MRTPWAPSWTLAALAVLALSVTTATARQDEKPATTAPVGEAAQPASCAAPLPLPSRFPADKSAYERILGRFLAARC
jgi:hypothetical protein